jgi:hypothetical protein
LPNNKYQLKETDNAYLEAQSVGETPALCDSVSAFTDYYSSCISCIRQLNSTATAPTEILPFVDYCDGQAAVNTSTQSSSVSLASTTAASFPVATATIQYTTTLDGVSTVLDYTQTFTLTSTQVAVITPISTATVQYTTTVDGTPTVWDFTRTVYPPVPETTVVLISVTVDNVAQVWNLTKTFSNLPGDQETATAANLTTSPSATIGSPTITTTPSTTTAGSSTVSSDGSVPASGEPSKAWIAGPVVGGVAGMAAILFMIWWILARRRKKKKMMRDNRQDLEDDAAIDPKLHDNFRPAGLSSSELGPDEPNAIHAQSVITDGLHGEMAIGSVIHWAVSRISTAVLGKR